MNTPDKNAYQRKSAKTSKPTYSRKKASMTGGDAKSAYVRKKQGPVSAANVAKVSKSLRQRLAGGAD